MSESRATYLVQYLGPKKRIDIMYSIALYQLWNFIAKLNGYFYSPLNMLLVFLHAIFGNGWIEGLKSQERKINII